MDAAASGRLAAGVGSGQYAERANIRSILVIQAAVACLSAAIAGLAAGWLDALSLLYGSTLMLANGLWLYRGIERATRLESGQELLYRSAVLRFVFLLLGLSLALVAKLYVPWVAVGMLVSQMVVYVYGLVSAWRARSN